MKIQILSDLHLEFEISSALNFDHADVVIQTGDTHLGVKGIELNGLKVYPKLLYMTKV